MNTDELDELFGEFDIGDVSEEVLDQLDAMRAEHHLRGVYEE